MKPKLIDQLVNLNRTHGFFYGAESESVYREQLLGILKTYSCEICWECGEPITNEQVDTLVLQDRLEHCHEYCSDQAYKRLRNK